MYIYTSYSHGHESNSDVKNEKLLEYDNITKYHHIKIQQNYIRYVLFNYCTSLYAITIQLPKVLTEHKYSTSAQNVILILSYT